MTKTVANGDKWACSQCNYGHGHKKGKSRNAIYKHFKKVHSETEVEVKTESEFVKIEEENPQIEEENFTESVEPESSAWGEIEWEDSPSIESEEVKARTIPQFVSDLNENRQVSREAQGQVVRLLFMSLDRALTHYGRGVMSNPEWSIQRAREDYDALEESTLNVMAYYGVSVPVSPLMVWGATVGSAYAPPLLEIRKKKDPNRPSMLRAIFSRFRRKKKPKIEVIENEH